MIHQKAAKAHSGSVIIWTLVWIVGMASIAWAAVTYAMPEFEKKQRRSIVRTVANMSELPLSINIQGFSATLSGQVQNAESKTSIVKALGFHKGVFIVNDKLRIADVKQVVDTPSTPFKFETLVVNLAGNSQNSPVQTPLRFVDKRQTIKPLSSKTDALVDNESEGDESLDDSIEPSATATNITADSTGSAVLPENEQQTQTLADAPEVEPATDTTPPLIEADDLSTALQASTEPKTENSPIDPISPSPGSSAKLESPVEPNAVLEDKEIESLTDKEAVRDTKTAGIQLAELAIPVEQTQPTVPSEPEATPNERLEVLIEEVLETARSEVQTSQSNDTDQSATPESATPESTTQALQQALSRLSSTKVLFELGSAVLTPDSVNTLKQVAEVLISFPGSTISIEGHTDASGESEANLALSLERAVVVRSYLIAQGVSMLTLRAKGYGEDKPLASNETATGRATNRRIEFKF